MLNVNSRQKKKWARGEENMWPNAKETAYCSGLWLGAGVVSIFLSGLAWHRPQSCPRHNSSYSTKEGERERGREMSGRGGVGELWCLSLPCSPMALLTIQHPPNYPPIHSHRDKASVLVCWSNMATNLSHSNITPTSLSLEVKTCTSAPQSPIVLLFVTAQQTTLLNFLRSSFCFIKETKKNCG